MKLPYILAVDDDPQVLRSIQRDLRDKYREDYRIVATDSALEAFEFVKDLKLRNEALALAVSDQRMPEMEGVDLLEKISEFFPESKKVLLTAYSDIEAAIKAINDVSLDYYLLKPWHPAEEKLYPVIDDLLDNWHAFYKPDIDAIRIIGFQWSPRAHQIKEFLTGNLVPYIWIDAESNEESEKYLRGTNVSSNDLPLIVLTDGTYLSDPSLTEIGSRIGLQQKAVNDVYDVLIIGAGPAGLAASVYGSCEGLRTILLEKSTPGGQAGNSARIENYLGFPTGVSGGELTRRAMTQTLRFGTEVLTPQMVKSISLKDGYKITVTEDGSRIVSKAVVIATGVSYAKLDIPGADEFSGAGVYYGSAAVEAHACRNETVFIAGGGNSACQAALYLSKFAREVNIVIRRDKLSQTAANYLVENISKTPNIKIITNTDIIACSGTSVLEELTLRSNLTVEEFRVKAKALFIYIGTKPSTEWLSGLVITNEKGFIVTGSELNKERSFNTMWKLDRQPYMPESSIPGVFASGDVRAGALAGISSAVGEGALAIRFVREYLRGM